MKMKNKCDINENYTPENFSKLPKNQQAEIYFGVAQVLFRRNQGMIATAYMTRALSLDPDLLALGTCDTYENDDYDDFW